MDLTTLRQQPWVMLCRLTYTDCGEGFRKFWGQVLFGLLTIRQVAGCVGGAEVTPALKRLFGRGGDADYVGVEDEAAAPNLVLADDFF